MPDTITKPVTWHAGGAIPLPDGKPRPWPEGWGDESPVIRAKTTAWLIHQNITATQGTWNKVICYCDPSDLDPPDFTKGADVG